MVAAAEEEAEGTAAAVTKQPPAKSPRSRAARLLGINFPQRQAVAQLRAAGLLDVPASGCCRTSVEEQLRSSATNLALAWLMLFGRNDSQCVGHATHPFDTAGGSENHAALMLELNRT